MIEWNDEVAMAIENRIFYVNSIKITQGYVRILFHTVPTDTKAVRHPDRNVTRRASDII